MTDEPRRPTSESDENRARTDDAAPDSLRATADAPARPGHDEAYACTGCGARWFYTRARCPECGAEEHESYELGVGTLLATTTARVTPSDVRDENPLGLAEFDDGVSVLAQLSTADRRPVVGDAVRLTGSVKLRDGVRGARLHSARTNQSTHPATTREDEPEVSDP